MLIDTHCHIHFPAYEEDREEVLQRARLAGVKMLVIGTCKKTSKEAILFAEQHQDIFATIGLHPQHTLGSSYTDPAEGDVVTGAEIFETEVFREMAKSSACVAVGECGLDYFRVPEGMSLETVKEIQFSSLRAQFELASELDLPVVIHCREAYEDQLALQQEFLDQQKLQRRGVVHCFAGNLAHARAFVAQGFFLGINGILTFPSRKTDVLIDGLTPLQHIVREIPLEHLLLETDAPYLTPHPHRGKRNEPAHVVHVAQRIAELKGCTVEEVARTTTENAQKLFRIK